MLEDGLAAANLEQSILSQIASYGMRHQAGGKPLLTIQKVIFHITVVVAALEYYRAEEIFAVRAQDLPLRDVV